MADTNERMSLAGSHRVFIHSESERMLLPLRQSSDASTHDCYFERSWSTERSCLSFSILTAIFPREDIVCPAPEYLGSGFYWS